MPNFKFFFAISTSPKMYTFMNKIKLGTKIDSPNLYTLTDSPQPMQTPKPLILITTNPKRILLFHFSITEEPIFQIIKAPSKMNEQSQIKKKKKKKQTEREFKNLRLEKPKLFCLRMNKPPRTKTEDREGAWKPVRETSNTTRLGQNTKP